MKKITWALACVLIVSCTGKNDKSSQKDLSFEQFFKSFSTDSIFQLSRIHFPLEYQSIDEEDKIDKATIKKSKWNYIDFSQDKVAYKHEMDKFKPVIVKLGNDSINYIREGIDNGINIEYTFAKVEKKWFLVKIIDMSN